MLSNLIDLMFLEARTFRYWLDKPVDDQLLQQAYDLAKMGPTSANCCPMRITFVKTPEAKEMLIPHLSSGNIDKVSAAPVTAIFAHDLEFYEKLPALYPHADARSWYVGKEAAIQVTALRNGTLQAAYYMLAVRSLGLDCGPMSGFDNAGVDQAFFKGTPLRSNFICNIGYGDKSKLKPRDPRLTFDEVCKIL